MEERYLSLAEAAAALDISERTAYRWINSGKLRAYKPGRDYRIPKSAIKDAVEESEVRPKAHRSSSPERSFNDALDELRTSRFAQAILAVAAEWGEAVSNPDMDDKKRFGLIDAALSLSGVIERQAKDEDWEAIPNQERLEIVTTMEKLADAAKKGIRLLEESSETRAQDEQVDQRRAQIRELTRRISA